MPMAMLHPPPFTLLPRLTTHLSFLFLSHNPLPQTEMAQPPMVTAEFSRSYWHPLWLVLIIGGIAVIISASICWFFRRRLFPAIFRRPWTLKGSLRNGNPMLRRFDLEEINKATKRFSTECLLGSGSFANVYKGTFAEEGTLAIKRHHSDVYLSVEDFRNEVMLLSRVRHKNLVSLVGYCEVTGAKAEKILVYEYVSGGSLLDHILSREGRSLTWRQRVNIAIGAAKGISHLHFGIKPSIIHRDIKPSNILVGDGFEAKVSDFGLVRAGPMEDVSHVSSQVKGTPGYLDPAYCSSLHLTTSSDVYSFGIILLQLVSGRPVLDSSRTKSRCHIVEWASSSLEMGRVEDILDANLLTEPCNIEVMSKMGMLGLKCVSEMPKERPTITEVWQELEDALHLADKFDDKKFLFGSQKHEPPQNPSQLRHQRSKEHEYSQSLASIDGIKFQKFYVDMDSLSFQSASLRCFEDHSIDYSTAASKENMF